MKPELIDSYMSGPQCEVRGKWYIAKPKPFYGLWGWWRQRVVFAWMVFRGRATAVRFGEDLRER